MPEQSNATGTGTVLSTATTFNSSQTNAVPAPEADPSVLILLGAHHDPTKILSVRPFEKWNKTGYDIHFGPATEWENVDSIKYDLAETIRQLSTAAADGPDRILRSDNLPEWRRIVRATIDAASADSADPWKKFSGWSVRCYSTAQANPFIRDNLDAQNSDVWELELTEILRDRDFSLRMLLNRDESAFHVMSASDNKEDVALVEEIETKMRNDTDFQLRALAQDGDTGFGYAERKAEIYGREVISAQSEAGQRFPRCVSEDTQLY